MTQQVNVGTPKKKSLPIAGRDNAPASDVPSGGAADRVIDVDAELKRFEAEERARLGLEHEQHWIEDMANLGFTKSQKSKITLLIGGLTMAHDYLVTGAFKSLGYETIALDCPDYDALRVGKEFGNRSQCNPTYFTVGNLVKYLIALRDQTGLTKDEIVEKFVFLTAGACGPCRFGMYVTEYRKALRDAGFDGFRVMLFQQQGGLSQATGEESGLELNPPFFIGLLKALLAGDVINGIGYRLRPYEVTPGATDKACAEAKKICWDALHEKRSILRALLKSRKIFEAVEIDRAIPKPKVAIIGEFWAMTTEGDGNYALQRFLEGEGAECDIQFVSAWILYNIWEVRFDTKSRALLRNEDDAKSGLKGSGEFGVLTRNVGLWLGDKALRAAFQTFAWCGGFYDYVLPDMDAVAEVAAPYYNNDLRGGEGHMEVGKLILNVVKSKATMTLSVKPFGCMPSSGVSDGVQSLITERFPGTIYCAVETSGDGAVNFYSRVQMYMFKAKQQAIAEFEKALADTGLSVDQLRDIIKRHPRLSNPLHHPPHRAGSTPADVVYEAAELHNTTPWQRFQSRAKRAAERTRDVTVRAVRGAPAAAVSGAKLIKTAGAELGEIVREKAPGAAESALASAKTRLSKLVPFGAAKNDSGIAAAAG